MEATADRFQGSEETLVRYWGYLEELAETDEIPFATDELVGFFSNLQDQGYPGVHHSETYRELYEPAYRVVLRQLVPLAVGEGCQPD